MLSWTVAILLPLALSISPTAASPLKRDFFYPAIPADFPDPAVLQVNNDWFGYATTNGRFNVQLAKSPSFTEGWAVLQQDALPNLASWAQGPVWAPDVIQRDDGQFIMYYSASLKIMPEKHCVGVAISRNPEGPFQPIGDVPLICPNPDARGYDTSPTIASPGVGGAIDASGFKDVDGQLYIVYKVDGNSVGSGGSCNNGDGRQSTPLMLVNVAADGFSPMGQPVQLLDRMAIDGPLVEAPNLIRTPDGQYNLFFSSNCYSTPEYDVSWATSNSLFGPYDRRGPLFTTGINGLVAPGGASIAKDGIHMVFHADFGRGRAMYTNRISGVRDSIRLID